MMKKKEVVLAMFAMLGLAAESSASGGFGVSAGLGASTATSISANPGVSVQSDTYASLSTSTNLGAFSGLAASTDTGVSTDAGASTGIGTATDIGTSTNIGTSVGETSIGLGSALGTSNDLGVSTGLGVSTDLQTSAGSGVFASTSGLTPLHAAVGVTATLPESATTKVTLDSPALDVTSEVVAAQAVNSTSTITVGAPAVAAIMKGDIEASKLAITADADASTSTEISALVASAAAAANPGISAVLDANTAPASVDIAGQSTSTFDLSATAGVENGLSIHPRLAVVADAAVSTVPEADTYAMLLAGLGLMGFLVNRRRKADIEI